MKKFETPTGNGEKNKGLPLWGYYNSLPESASPKSDFLREVSLRCGVSPTTVRNWIFFNTRPSKPEYIKAISEITGIPESELWGGIHSENGNGDSQSN